MKTRKKLEETETENKELREQVVTNLKGAQPINVVLFPVL